MALVGLVWPLVSLLYYCHNNYIAVSGIEALVHQSHFGNGGIKRISKPARLQKPKGCGTLGRSELLIR
jgi:hypothetical protein